MASLIFDPSEDARGVEFDTHDIETGRRGLRGELPWYLFLQRTEKAGFRPVRKQIPSLGYLLGQGVNSEVYRSRIDSAQDRLETWNPITRRYLDRGTVVALKRVKTQSMLGNEGSVLRAMEREIRVLGTEKVHKSEYVVKLHCVWWESRAGMATLWPTLVTEYCDCTLAELLRCQRLEFQTKSEITTAIFQGFDDVWMSGFIHGDIKSENILIKRSGDGTLVPKISDFGSSVQISLFPLDAMVELSGSDPWRAPECVGEDGKPQTIAVRWAQAADCFALALLWLVVLGDGVNPFHELYELEDDWIRSHRRAARVYASSATALPHDEEVDWRAVARAVTNKAIQELKSTGGLFKMVLVNLNSWFPDDESQRARFGQVFETWLLPNPEHRFMSAHDFNKKHNVPLLHPPEEPEAELHVRSFQSKQLQAAVSEGFQFPLIELVNAQLKDADLRPGRATQEKIFNEIRSLLRMWEQQHPSVCEACCGFSALDISDDTSSVINAEDIVDLLFHEAQAPHTCNVANPFTRHTDFDLVPQFSDQPLLVFNLFTCYVDGYGVDSTNSHDAALDWLMWGARRGAGYLQELYSALHLQRYKCLPSGVPVVKWLAMLYLMGGSPLARDVLRATRPEVVLAIEEVRDQMIGTGFTLDEWQAGLEMQSWSKSDMEEILSALKSRYNVDARDEILSKLESVIPARTAVDFDASLITLFKDGNELIHIIASNWTQPLGLSQQYLDRYPEALDGPNDFGETPLLLACRAGRFQIVDLLVERGADVSIAAGHDGESPMHWLALHANSHEQVKTLLAKGAQLDAFAADVRAHPGRTFGRMPSYRGHLRRGTPLGWAVQALQQPMVEFLVGQGADVLFGYKDHDCPLTQAVLARDANILEFCVSAAGDLPADLNLFGAFFRDITATTRAVTGVSQEEEIRVLEQIMATFNRLDSAADIDDQICTWLYTAVHSLPLPMIRCILDGMECVIDRLEVPFHPEDETVRRYRWQSFGYGVCDAAILRDDASVVEFLVKRACDRGYDRLDRHLQSVAFDFAIGPDNPDVLDVLVEYGVTFVAPNEAGLLPVHLAILHGNIKIAQAMVSRMQADEFDRVLGRGSSVPFTPRGIEISFFGYMIFPNKRARVEVKGLEWLFTLPPSATDFFNIYKTAAGETILGTALHCAMDGLRYAQNDSIYYSQRPVIDCLLRRFSKPEHINAVDGFGLTPLHVAAYMGNSDHVELLISAGADINAIDRNVTPLDMTFAPPPMPQFAEMVGEPTREVVQRFVDGRNGIAMLLRRKKALSSQEIYSQTRLGDWIPYPLGIGQSMPLYPYMMSVCQRRGWSRLYGRLVPLPPFKRPGLMPGPLKGPPLPWEVTRPQT